MTSPYTKVHPSRWLETTKRLNQSFPVPMQELVSIVHDSWAAIFRLSPGGFKIGVKIFPQPQTLGFFLHELIPLKLAAQYPGDWKVGESKTEFDAHYVKNQKHSFEIKSSSSRNGIFGNRSYTHVSDSAKKRRGGRMLAVNFEKCSSKCPKPQLTLIRFGWLDSDDWRGQTAASGQQASLTLQAKASKLEVIWDNSQE